MEHGGIIDLNTKRMLLPVGIGSTRRSSAEMIAFIMEIVIFFGRCHDCLYRIYVLRPPPFFQGNGILYRKWDLVKNSDDCKLQCTNRLFQSQLKSALLLASPFRRRPRKEERVRGCPASPRDRPYFT